MARVAPWFAAEFGGVGAAPVGAGPIGGSAEVHHDNDECLDGKAIPAKDRKPGDGGLPRCSECTKLD